MNPLVWLGVAMLATEFQFAALYLLVTLRIFHP